MKSIFSGVSAKLALAVLAVGTMFTSCYDSENGDVTVPPMPEKPQYIVTGYVTDYETGMPIEGATVTVGSKTATTTGGAYTLELTEVTSETPLAVSIAATDYLTVSRSLIVTPITSGVALYTVDAALMKEAALPGIKVDVLDNKSASAKLSAEDNVALDLVNDTDEPVPANVTFANLQAGAAFVSDYTPADTKAASDDPKTAFVEYCKAYLGVDPSAGFTTTSKQFNFTIAAQSSVKSATINTYGVTERYTFTLNGEEYSYVINRISGYSFVPEVVLNEIYHGHGHGHGHGGELNAGGGIWE